MSAEGAASLWRPRLVALDVDGTIANYDGSISPAVAEAVRAVAAHGVAVVLATGRSMHGTLPECDELGLFDGLAVCSNGAVIADVHTRSTIQVVTFDATDAVRFFASRIPDALLAVEVVGVGYRVTGRFPEGELGGEITVVPPDALLDGPATRLIARWPNGDRQLFFQLAREAGLRGIDYAIGYDAWLDVMPAGVSKASGLQLVCQRLGIDPADALAVGDGHNDLEMLAWAGLGVAMGNAAPDVQAAADEVAGGIDDDGLVDLLARWF